jgi:hypothetical protein
VLARALSKVDGDKDDVEKALDNVQKDLSEKWV